MKTLFKKALAINVIVAGAFLASAANANLIVNGGFEDKPDGSAIGGGSGWKYYSAEDVSWEGSNVEIWTDRTPGAYEGEYHAELNSHGEGSPFSISQTFATEIGQSYDLFFAYGARVGTGTESSEVFEVSVANWTFQVSDHIKNQWSEFSGSFIATGSETTLSFTSIFPTTTVGNFLDDIRVTASVPEPSTFALLALGLVGLSFSRKQVKKAN